MTLAVLVQSARSLPPGPRPPAAFTGVRHTWQGWDGVVWDLSDPRSGVVMLEGPLEGLLNVPHERYVSRSAGRPGSRTTGHRALERPVFWTIGVYHDESSAAWVALNRDFARSLDRRRPGVWTVYLPDGSEFSLVCRFVRVDPALNGDPVADGLAAFGIELVADEQPYWRGHADPHVFDLADGAGGDFIPETGAPDFEIVQASTIAGATVENPGDVASWPVYTVTAASDDVVLGVGSDRIGVQLALTEADTLRIDTLRQVTTLNGERVRGVLNPHEFAPIPARSRMPLNLTATGTGQIKVDVVPLYERVL